jgi:hypothetical protein
MEQDKDGIRTALQADFESATDESFTLLHKNMTEEAVEDGKQQRDPERSASGEGSSA